MKKFIISIIIIISLLASQAQAFWGATYIFNQNGWDGGAPPAPNQSVLQGGGLGDNETPVGGMWYHRSPEWLEFIGGLCI